MVNLADPTVTVLGSEVTLAAIGVAALQALKNSKWFPYITADTAKLNRFVAVLAAAVGAIGVHIAWNQGAVPGSYMIEVTGLTLTGVAIGAWALVKQVVYQEIIYRATRNNSAPTPAAPLPVK